MLPSTIEQLSDIERAAGFAMAAPDDQEGIADDAGKRFVSPWVAATRHTVSATHVRSSVPALLPAPSTRVLSLPALTWLRSLLGGFGRGQPA